MATGNEWALLQIIEDSYLGKAGQYILIEGDEGGVNIPIHKSVRLLYHTHPNSSNWPSNRDIDTLQDLFNAGSPYNYSSIIAVIGTEFKQTWFFL